MTPLNHKLMRDLWRIRGQVLAIALVVASGIANLVMALSTVEALEETSQAYYERYRFGDVFAQMTRAPDSIGQKIAAIDGVQSVQTRISHFATVDVSGFEEPIIGQMMSIPESGQPLLSQLALRQGRWVQRGRSDEVIIGEPFAEGHDLRVGDTFKVVMKGKQRTLTVVGIALCPEFIYALGPGALLPDDKRFGILWMGREALSAAFELEDAFNNLTLTLLPGIDAARVLPKIDALLEPYGGTQAILRKDQLSNWFLMNEIQQQKTMGSILPTIFIAVAAFLTNMVLTRLIATERTEIGLLKAFGYSNRDIGLYYFKMITVIIAVGLFIGSLMGLAFGRLNTEMYADMFRFPLLIYRPGWESFIISGAISYVAALSGGLMALRQATGLSPAEAMQPPTPVAYRQSLLSQLSLFRWLDQPTRIAIRQIRRWPLRAFLTSAGIGFAVALVVMSLQWDTALRNMARVNFYEAQRQDLMLGMSDPRAMATLSDFYHLPGVLTAEPMRYSSVEFRFGSARHRGSISGVPAEGHLQPIFDDARHQVLPVPKDGLVLATRLAKKLGVSLGDTIEIELLEGRRTVTLMPVVALVNTYIGMPAYLNLNRLNELLGDGPSYEYANLLVDDAELHRLLAELKTTPNVSSVMIKQAAIDAFYSILYDHVMVFIWMFSFLAALLALGVVYNSTRIALSERGRELATLRVLGFSRGEISYVLLGEVMFLVLFGFLLGIAFGWGLVVLIAAAFDTELFRIPLVFEAATFVSAILVVLAATLISMLIVRARVDKLDLIRVLKTRE